MSLMMELRDGTKARVVLADELETAIPEGAGLEPACATRNDAVVFYVPNRLALDRLLARYGAARR